MIRIYVFITFLRNVSYYQIPRKRKWIIIPIVLLLKSFTAYHRMDSEIFILDMVYTSCNFDFIFYDCLRVISIVSLRIIWTYHWTLWISTTLLLMPFAFLVSFLLWRAKTYRVGHLAFGISTTGYFEFERRNNIYDVSEI